MKGYEETLDYVPPLFLIRIYKQSILKFITNFNKYFKYVDLKKSASSNKHFYRCNFLYN